VPDTHRIFRVPVGEEVRNDVAPEELERLRIAEKAGHTDQDILTEGLGLLGVFLENVDILPESSCLVSRHPPLDPPQYGVLFVGAEIVAGRGLDLGEYCDQFLIEGGGQAGLWGKRTVPMGYFGNSLRNFFRRNHHIRRTSGNGVLRHRWMNG